MGFSLDRGCIAQILKFFTPVVSLYGLRMQLYACVTHRRIAETNIERIVYAMIYIRGVDIVVNTSVEHSCTS